MYSLTLFRNRYDNKTNKTMSFETWDEFVSLLYMLSDKPDTKATAPLISPAKYTVDTTRSNKNVECWTGWAAVDVDDIDIPAGKLKDRLVEDYGHWDFVCYSTASSREDKPKFRLVFNLGEEVESDQLKAFWWALNTELNEIGDKQTKDLSRMYYVPAKYEDAYNFIWRNEGRPVDADYLIGKHPYKEKEGKNFLDRLPDELQKAVVAHRKNSMNNTEFTWTSYHDCPFFPKTLARDYQYISETGWYHKMYQIMIAVAGSAVKRGYPISAKQIADMCQELDNETGQWYGSRPLEREADRALEYIYRNG